MDLYQESLFIRATKRQAVPRTPVWLMRQAGRYLPEYRKIRQQAGDFLTLCKTPELACEVTLQPLRRYALDAAILFSDILTIPDAMGLGLHFIEGEGPCFHSPIQTANEVKKLPLPEVNDALNYVFSAIKLIRRELRPTIPLIGFSGSPWTLACYMIEGQGRAKFPLAQQFKKEEPRAMQELLDKLTKTVFSYLLEQIKSGVNAVMIFDTWGGILSTEDYLLYSLKPIKIVIQQLKQQFPEIPVLLFTKGGGAWLLPMLMTGCDVIGLDWTTSLKTARDLVGERVSLQGNLEPSILLKSENEIIAGVEAVLASYGVGHGHIFNLGHGITPEVPPENVTILIETVQQKSPQYHR